MNNRLFLTAIFFLSVSAVMAQWIQKQYIITFWEPPLIQHADQLKRDGFNYFSFYRISGNNDWREDYKLLDKAKKEGLKVVYAPIHTTAASAIKNQNSTYWQKIIAHPAYGGFFFQDEPGLSHLKELNEAISDYKAMDTDPTHFAWINLFPSYASQNQLGCGPKDSIDPQCYEEYVKQFAAREHVDFLSYDFYRFMNDHIGEKEFFDNIALISKEAKLKKVPFIVFLQGSQFRKQWKLPTYTELSWQACMAMTYGAKGIAWFIYDMFDSNLGCYNVHYPDKKNPNDKYSRVRQAVANDLAKINQFIKATGAELLNLEPGDVFHTDTNTDSITRSPVKVSSGKWVIGTFSGKDTKHRSYFMITNKDLKHAQTASLELSDSRNTLKKFEVRVADNPYPEKKNWKVRARWKSLTPDSFKRYKLTLQAGEGILCEIVKP